MCQAYEVSLAESTKTQLNPNSDNSNPPKLPFTSHNAEEDGKLFPPSHDIGNIVSW